MRRIQAHRRAHGLTFRQLARESIGKVEVLREVLRDEVRRGRVTFDGRRYTLVPEAFPTDVLAALRNLQPPGTPDDSHPAAHPTTPWSAGREAAAWRDLAWEKRRSSFNRKPAT
jgi:hypothetical protein